MPLLSSTSKDTIYTALEERSFAKIFDSVFILRPTLMFPLITMILVGHRISDAENSLAWERWFFLVLALCAMFGLGYLLNQIRDRKSDQQNGKLILIAEGVIGRKHLVIEIVILSSIVPLMLHAAGFSRLIVWVLAMFLVGGIFYNFKPLSLQNHPLGGLLAGLIGGVLLLRFGGMIVSNPTDWLSALPYIIAFGAASLLTDLLDREGDTANGKKTFVVVYGYRTTMLTSLVGFIIAGLLGLYNWDWVITVPAFISSPVLFWGWKKNSVRVAVLANKIAIFTLSVAIGVFYPVYLVVIGLYYPLARWYYARRLGMRYPSFELK